MRIAMVSEHASPLATLGGADAGGQNVHVAELSRHLAAAGHEVEVYTRRDDADLPDRVPLDRGVDVVHVTAGPAAPLPKDDLLPWMDAMGDELARLWSAPARRPDVVHAHFWMSGLAAVRAARQVEEATGVHVPVLQTFHALGSVKRRHQGAADTSPARRVELEARLCRDVDRVVATCHDEVDELDALGAPADRIRVVPCGVDLGRFTPGADRAAQDSRTGLRLLSVGRLVERKGVGTVIEALADVPDAELLVAGGPAADSLDDDREVCRLRKLAAEHGVADRVRFLGAVAHQDVPGLLRSVDVVVCTPWYEPFGIVPLEAAACGRPVVGSAVGGLLDTVVDGRTGLLVPPRDAAALARALRRLTDRPTRLRYGAAARVRAEHLYGWATVARRTAEVYAELAPDAAMPWPAPLTVPAPGAADGVTATTTGGAR
jgi:glycosyltransferase involved in cell wall biosynthesis